MIESFPQLIIQLYYLFKTNTFYNGNNSFIIFSVCFSLLSMINKAVTEDKPLFIQKWQESEWKCKLSFVSYRYILRLFFRFFDISSRVLIIVLVWIEFGGEIVFIVLLCLNQYF